MDDTATLIDPLVPDHRECTRCDAEQHLIDSHHGMGKYRCEHCQMVVGFDLETDAPEFLLDRGSPGRYTKDVFGDRLLPREQRLEPVHD